MNYFVIHVTFVIFVDFVVSSWAVSVAQRTHEDGVARPALFQPGADTLHFDAEAGIKTVAKADTYEVRIVIPYLKAGT